MILEIITNNIFLSAVLAAWLAQFLKALIDWLYEKKFNRRSIVRAAGMPSSHTATVVALTISVFLIEWVNTISIITLIFSAIIIRDVIWDKVFATQQENLINMIIKDIIKNHKVQRNHLIWHSWLEVIFWGIVWVVSVLMVFHLI